MEATNLFAWSRSLTLLMPSMLLVFLVLVLLLLLGAFKIFPDVLLVHSSARA